MKAVANSPGQAHSIHLAELPTPSMHEIANGHGVSALTSVTDGHRQHAIPADKINLILSSETNW